MMQPLRYLNGRQLRPVINALSKRGFCSRRNIPVVSPWRSRHGVWDDFFRFPGWSNFREVEKQFEDAWRQMERMVQPEMAYGGRNRAGAMVRSDDKTFEIQVDVRQYEPSEINVKLAENRLTVTGKHESKSDEHGRVFREFHREFNIPENVDLESMSSTLSDEGVLTLQARVKEAEKPADRVIEIQREAPGDKDK